MQKNPFKKYAQKCVFWLKSARFKIEQRQLAIQRIIEGYFEKSLTNGGFSFSDALIVAMYSFTFNIMTIETIFTGTIIFVAFISSGAAGFFAGEHFLLVFLFWNLILLLCFVIVYITTSFFLLFHLMRGQRLFAMLLFSILTASLVISYLIPLISGVFFENLGVRFSQMALPTMLIFLITQIFLFVQHKNKLCYLTYCKRMKNAVLSSNLGQDIDGQILVLSAQDHYVEYTTTTGKKLVRMRMREAIARMRGQQGLSVHRSHWVAIDAIKSLHKKNGKRFLLLTNGDKIPVSASKLAAVKKAIKSYENMSLNSRIT